MKVEFELTINTQTGAPVITFRHHDRSNALEQRLLKVFLDKAKSGGIILTNPSGYLEAGTQNSWENYVIQTVSK